MLSHVLQQQQTLVDVPPVLALILQPTRQHAHNLAIALDGVCRTRNLCKQAAALSHGSMHNPVQLASVMKFLARFTKQQTQVSSMLYEHANMLASPAMTVPCGPHGSLLVASSTFTSISLRFRAICFTLFPMPFRYVRASEAPELWMALVMESITTQSSGPKQVSVSCTPCLSLQRSFYCPYLTTGSKCSKVRKFVPGRQVGNLES